jgi:lysozyme
MNKFSISALIFSASALIMLATNEGFNPNPYKDTGGVITNGFGNSTIDPHKTVSVTKALSDLEINTSKIGSEIKKCITSPITQGQYDAFVSFSYNVGSNAFCKSTMAKKANAGDLVGSCNEFKRWTYVAGKDCREPSNNCLGIVNRRKKEYELCLS